MLWRPSYRPTYTNVADPTFNKTGFWGECFDATECDLIGWGLDLSVTLNRLYVKVWRIKSSYVKKIKKQSCIICLLYNMWVPYLVVEYQYHILLVVAETNLNTSFLFSGKKAWLELWPCRRIRLNIFRICQPCLILIFGGEEIWINDSILT